MSSTRQLFGLRLYLIGFGVVLLLAGVVAVVLVRADLDSDVVVEGVLFFLLIALMIELVVVRQLLHHLLRPTGRAAGIAIRVAQGDLSLWPADARAKDQLSTSLSAMLDKLRELVGTIRQHAHEAAAMSEQIAASTQEMSASTEEV